MCPKDRQFSARRIRLKSQRKSKFNFPQGCSWSWTNFHAMLVESLLNLYIFSIALSWFFLPCRFCYVLSRYIVRSLQLVISLPTATSYQLPITRFLAPKRLHELIHTQNETLLDIAVYSFICHFKKIQTFFSLCLDFCMKFMKNSVTNKVRSFLTKNCAYVIGQYWSLGKATARSLSFTLQVHWQLDIAEKKKPQGLFLGKMIRKLAWKLAQKLWCLYYLWRPVLTETESREDMSWLLWSHFQNNSH